MRASTALSLLALVLALAALGLAELGGGAWLGPALLAGAAVLGVAALPAVRRRLRGRAVLTAVEHVAKRLGWAVLIVFGVGSIAFFMARWLPGDPGRMLLGPQARPADVAQARKIYGLDQPLSTQYAVFWSRLLHLAPPRGAPGSEGDHRSCAEIAGAHVDLGFSFRYQRPVVALIGEKAPRSLELAVAALLFQALIGLTVGIVAARRRGSLYDQLSVGATLIGISAPTFLLGLGLQYLLAYKLGWLPYDGYGETLSEQLRSVILPALTLGVFGAALYARLARDELLVALSQDYIRSARARGASELRVMVVHALRNALVPLATLMVLDLGALIGGAVVTERVFRWPGMGYLAVDALVNRDGPVIFGTVLFAALAIVLATLLLDLLYVVLDPRLRRRT